MIYSRVADPVPANKEHLVVNVGEKAPSFELPDHQGQPWNLSGQLEAGPVMLVFYRGDWCPYCNGQLVSFARQYGEFERRGAQVAAISVDPPENSVETIGKLMLPFPLLGDPRGDLAKLYGLWDGEESVAVPAIVVVDRSGEIRYLYAGADFADRPGDEEVFAALDDVDGASPDAPRDPEVRVTPAEAREASVRPDKPPMTLDRLVPYYRGALFTTVALKKRFEEWGRRGRDALEETDRYQAMIKVCSAAIRETVEAHREA